MANMMSLCPMHLMSPQIRVKRSAKLVQLDMRGIRTTVCAAEQISPPGGAAGGGHIDPPKLEPFSQSRLSRSMRERSFLQKTEDALNDRCMALEGEAAYECWEALFEYENIKEAAEKECNIAQSDNREEACRPLERLQNMVRQSGGVNSLIANVRMVAKIKEANKLKPSPSETDWVKTVSAASEEDKSSRLEEVPEGRHEFIEDGGIPKTSEEMQEEMEAMMPESPFTRVLKRRGHHS